MNLFDKIVESLNAKEAKTYRQKIIDHMTKKNWKMIGEGVFAVVFTNPAHNKVIKIIAPDHDEVTRAAKHFKRTKEVPTIYSNIIDTESKLIGKWMKFIDKNKDNPHLPKYSKTSEEEVGGLKITLYTMEKLRPLNLYDENLDQYAWLLTEIFFMHGKINKKIISDLFMEKLDSIIDSSGSKPVWDKSSPSWFMPSNELDKRYMNTKTPEDGLNLLLKDFGLYMDTVSKVISAGTRAGYDEDLHQGNIMIRPNSGPLGGVPVITDPWKDESGVHK